MTANDFKPRSRRIAYNGRVVEVADLPPEWGFNRGFALGDGLFETIRAARGRVLWAERHYARLTKGFEKLGMAPPSGFSLDYFVDICEEILATNKINGGGRLRLTVYRAGGGPYLPQTDEVEWVLEAVALLDSAYLWTRPLRVTVCSQYPLTFSPFSEIKTLDGFPYIMAARYAGRLGLDNAILPSTDGALVELTNANLFLVRDKSLLTPPIETGCVAGVLRKIILELAAEMDLTILEAPFDGRALSLAQEAFGTNVIGGVIPIRSADGVTFPAHQTALLLLGALNERAGV